MPYGAGFHPWFPRTNAATLRAPVDAVWLEDDQHLLTEQLPIVQRAEWDFSSARSLPPSWINNAFTGWRGNAQITWPEHGVSLAIEAASDLSTYVVYSPNADVDFFCFEPVSHPVDAHHLPADLALHGLRPLVDGETLQTWCRFIPTTSVSITPARQRARRHRIGPPPTGCLRAARTACKMARSR